MERCRKAWMLLFLATACTVPKLPLDGKSCNEVHPCVDGYACIGGICVSPLLPDGGRLNPDAGPTARPPPGLCSVDSWCYELPELIGLDLNGASAVSRNEVYAVGQGGVALRFEGNGDGGTWFRENTPTKSVLRGVWADAPGSAWAVGSDGVILRRADGGWTRVDGSNGSIQLNAVSGNGANSAVAVGEQGTVLAWNGSSWSGLDAGSSASLRGTWTDQVNDHWIVGTGGEMLHLAGSTFSRVSVSSNDFYGISGTGPNDIWAVGKNAQIFHKTGSWQPVSSTFTTDLIAVWAGSANFAVASLAGAAFPSAIIWDGGSWTEHPANLGLIPAFGVTGSAPDDVWLVGEAGTLRHFNGTDWGPSASGGIGFFNDIWGTSPLDVWTVDAFFSGVVHFDGKLWRGIALPPAAVLSRPNAVWGSSPDDVWFGAISGQILHFNGLSISVVSNDAIPPLRALWGSSTNDVWAAGENGTLLRWTGDRWRLVNSGTAQHLNRIWGSAGNDVWAIGDNGVILHFDGQSWSSVPSGVSVNLQGVHGTSKNDVWVVGLNTVLHYDGSQWKISPGDGAGMALDGVWAAFANEAYAVSSEGKILYWNGTSWLPQDSGADGIILTKVTGFGPGDVWVSGNQGVVLRRAP